MLDNHDTSSSSENDTLRQYDLTLSTTSLSLSVNVTHILSWVNAELEENYIKHDTLSTIRNLETDWQDGRAFLCLAHRFYPTSIPRATFDSLLDQDDGPNSANTFETRSCLAFSVFEKELALTPPTLTNPYTPIPLYIAKVRQTLLSNNQQHTTFNDNDDIWTQRTEAVVSTIQFIRQQLHELDFRPSSQAGYLKNNTDNSPSIPDNELTPNSDQPVELSDNEKEDDKATAAHTGATSWEDDLSDIEQRLVDLDRIMEEYHAWTDDNMDSDAVAEGAVPTQTEKRRRLALIQSVDNAYLSLQDYLEHGQQVLVVFRKRALFTQATAPIRQDLDWVQAEMLKTTTTDTGIKELEERVANAGTLLQQLIQQYSEHQHQQQPSNIESAEIQPTIDNNNNHTDQQQQQHLYAVEVDALEKKYKLVQSWVEDVRVWFVEAQRIRKWIGERIDMLENSDVPDGVLSQHLTVTADHVEDLNTRHEALEKEVELFDKEDMSRLRTHVKDLTVVSTKEKDLSPADTTTIEITFTTLMILDRLMHLLNRRSYDLQVLTLRVFWENEYLKTETWIQTLAEELNVFISSQARWQDDDHPHGNDPNERKDVMAAILSQSSTLKSIVIDKLLEFETDISTFDQGQFTTTVNLYQELDDTSKVELPGFLESRQVGVEETFEVLVHRATFARHVVEQYLTMADFMDTSGNLLYCYGDDLHEKLMEQTDKVHSLFLDQQNAYDGNDGSLNDAVGIVDLGVLEDKPLVDENAYFQEHAVRLITDTASLIPYTETTHILDQQENEAGNHRVHLTVKSRSSELILFGESLEYKLTQYQKAIRWHAQLNDVNDDLQHMQTSINNDISSANDVSNKLTSTFGDQISELSGALIHDKKMATQWNLELQRHVDNISTYETGLGAVDDHIQGLLVFYEQPSSSATSDMYSIPTTVTETIKFLETGAQLASSQLQKLASTLDQWKSGLSMMKDRQSWESQYLVATEWMTTHKQKCQHIREASVWSLSENAATEHQKDQHGVLGGTALVLGQEWDAFKNQSLSSLANAFKKLTGSSSCSAAEKAWAIQQQRQNGIMSGAKKIDDILALARALLGQRMAITRFLDGADAIRFQGTQWLTSLKWMVSQRDMDCLMAVSAGNEHLDSVDTYNSLVVDLWQKWETFDNRATTLSAGANQDDLDLDLDQQCGILEAYASEKHHLLLSLGHSLRDWEDTAKETTEIRHDSKIWSEKVQLLDTRVDDLHETLALERDTLLKRLAKDCVTTLGGSGNSDDDDDLAVNDANQRIKDMDRLFQQWMEHDFDLLYADGLTLNARVQHLMEKLLGLTRDEDKEWSLDSVNDIKSTDLQLDKLRSHADIVIKPAMSLVLKLFETSDKRDSWESTYSDMSLILERLQVRLEDVVLAKQGWLKKNHCNYSVATLHDLLDTVNTVALELNDVINSDGGHGLLDAENKCYAIMVESYHSLLNNSVDSYSVGLPIGIDMKHHQCQQSIQCIESTVKRLVEDMKWLETGATWLHLAEEQFRPWETLMGDLDYFIEHDAKWTIEADAKINLSSDTCGDALPQFDTNAALLELKQHVDNLSNNIDSVLDKWQAWKSSPLADSTVDLEECDIWKQKASQLKNCRSDANVYKMYASNLVAQQNKLQDWSRNVNQAELQGEQSKSAMLLDHDNDVQVADEPLQLLAAFDENLAHVLDCAQSVNYPTRPHLLTWKKSTTAGKDNVENGRGGDDEIDLVIRQYIQSQHEHLNNLSISLNGILSANERSTRLKSLVEGYVAKALESLQWINSTDNKLQQLVPDYSDAATDWEILKSRLDLVIELEYSTHEYKDTHYHVLKESENHCITAIQLDVEESEQIINDSNSSMVHLDRVYSLQHQVENAWQQLLDSMQQHNMDLKKHIQQAERSYWCNKVMEKCKTINGELDNANMDNLQDDQLDQWRHDISGIKTIDMDYLRKLFVVEDIGDLDMATHLKLDKATMSCQQLGNRLQLISDSVEFQRRRMKHSLLTVSLIGFTDNTKSKLAELHSTLGALPVELTENADNEFYCHFRTRMDSVLSDFGGHENIYRQEGDLFLSICYDDDEDDVGATETNNEQHKQVEIGWTELQQMVARLENDYDSMVQRRPIFDVLYQVSSILSNIDALPLGTGETDIDGTQQDVDRAKELLAMAASNIGQHNCSITPTEDKDEIYTAMDVIYKQRYGTLLDRMGIVEGYVEYHQKQQQLHQLHQQYQDREDEIKASAQGELAALESLRLQNSNLPDTAVFDPYSGTQHYQQWAKKVESSEQVLHSLARDTTALATAASTDSLEKGNVNEIAARCQLPLGKLKDEIEYEKSLLDLTRRILGLGKSANNITSWLTHFEKAVGEISINDSMTSKPIDEKLNQALEDKISGLEAKLQGFEPIMASLGKMNLTIQGISQLDHNEKAVELQWKQSARNRFDKVNVQWRDCLDSLEAAKKMAAKTKQTTMVTRKIEYMVTFLGDIRDQVEQLQNNTFLVNTENSSSKTHYQDQHPQLDMFRKLPRDRDISSAEEKLTTIKRRLTVQGRNQRTEIDQLVEQYISDQQTDCVEGEHFLEQQKEMHATWTSVVETIDSTKSSLANKKAVGRYLSKLDDIDLLLDSMDEVLLKADPLYYATLTDRKPSKAELRAKLIELNARYNYYSINIQQSLQHADEAWTLIKENGDMDRQKLILENHGLGQQTRWSSMVHQQVPSRQLELKKGMEQPLGNTERKTRLRKTSLPTRKAAGTLTPPPRLSPSTLSSNSRPTKAALATSFSSSSETLRSSTALHEGHRRLRTVSSASTLTSNRRPPVRQQESSSTSTVVSTNKKRTVTPTRKRPNSYVAQAGNDLDMEIGRIVNDTPYRIKVKMVPGEVGRYWFGDINPKIVYCRVLKSKMVMVRVGGGWTELSQFLRDHALLEGELIIPKKQNQMHTLIQEGYLETTTSLQRQRQQFLQQHVEQIQQQNQYSVSSTTITAPNLYLPSRTPTPTMKKSISTPPNKNDALQQKGYKDGDKFYAVDRHGNQLEVKMTRFRQQGALPTSITNRRRKLDKS